MMVIRGLKRLPRFSFASFSSLKDSSKKSLLSLPICEDGRRRRCILKWILILRGDDISWAEQQKSWHNEALPTSQFGFWRSMMKSCQFWHEDTSRLDEQKWEPLYHTNMANGRSFERSKSPKYLNFLSKNSLKQYQIFRLYFQISPY